MMDRIGPPRHGPTVAGCWNGFAPRWVVPLENEQGQRNQDVLSELVELALTPAALVQLTITRGSVEISF
jgi:hypothetical protein